MPLSAEEKQARRERAQKNRVNRVCKNTGWSYETALQKMLQAEQAAGASFEHYLGFRLWELTEDEQKTYFMKGDADAIYDKFNTNPNYTRVAYNKSRFLKKFKDYVGRPWIITSEMDYERFCETFQNEHKVIYKPKTSSAGAGIRVYELTPENLRAVYDELRTLNDGVVEGFLHQHPDMQKLSLRGVNTIRVVTVCPEKPFTGLEAGKVHIAYAAVRMCQGDSYTDNAHQGGLVAGVDLDTGRINTDGFDYKGIKHLVHPDTKTTIRGFQIPFFAEMKQLICQAGLMLPGYFGWDMAISQSGPVVIELNTHPGAELLQLPHVPERKGMRYVMQRFIDAKPIESSEAESSVRTEGGPFLRRNAAVTGVKAALDAQNRPVVTWEAADEAEGYQVYRAASEAGPYRRILTTANLKCTNVKNVEPNTTYYYKVRAVYADGVTGSFSGCTAVLVP